MLLANSTHPDGENITITPGTILALRPAKHYFSLYHPHFHVTATSSGMSSSQVDAGFIGLQDSSSDESDEDEVREVRMDPLGGLRMWLDRLVDGSLTRINVSSWPEL